MPPLEVSFASGATNCAATVYRPASPTGLVGCVVMGNGVTLTRNDGIPGYAQRFADAGFAALAFDYRHWGDSGGEPRRWVSLARQLEDWHTAVDYARSLEGVDSERIALWGMSLGGGLALMTAAADPRIAATVALVPMADGLEAWRRPVPPGVTLRLMWRAIRGALTRGPVIVPLAGPPRSFALIATPEALPGFNRLASGNGWRNEVNIAGATLAFPRFRPVKKAGQIRGAVLLQAGERDEMAPPRAIQTVGARAPHAHLAHYPIDHFGCYWPEYIDQVAGDQLEFLQRHMRPLHTPNRRTNTMSTDAKPRPTLTIAQMDELIDRHFRAEETGDLDAIAAGFTRDAEHDVAGRPGGVLRGGEQIAAFYEGLLAELQIERFATIRRWYGNDHVVDESMLHGRAIGRPFGLAGNGKQVQFRLLHVFDFKEGLISRESAWLDLAALRQRLAG